MNRLRSTLSVLLLGALGFTPLDAQTPGRRPVAAPSLPAYDVMEKPIEELQRAMQAGEVTSRQLVDLYLARIDAYDQRGPALNAITALNPKARDAADALDVERKAGRMRGPLHGIPVLVKDNYETVEMPTSAGSIALAGFHPARDATMVRKLKDAGAVIIGKTNMHELAAGITTVGSRFGQTKNPYDLDRNPGGSSGGTGSAIAANFAVAGMGSDTCGSIRNPASHNNLVGLRGTQGLSSRTGIVPLSSTQDIGGPIARRMTDLALMLDATVGPDTADAQTAVAAGRIPPSYRALLSGAALKGTRIGVVRELFGNAPEDQEVTTIVNRALDVLKKAGAEISDVEIPGLNGLLRDGSMITADFRFDLAEYLARDGHAPVQSLGEILDRGLYHTALEGTFRERNAVEARETEQSRRAKIKRVALRQAVESTLAEHRLTALVYPTLRRRPARVGDGQLGSQCQLSAHSGLPALGLPAGFTDDEVPVGMDVLGAAFSEAQLLGLGYAIEQTLNLRRAPFSTPALRNGKAPAAKTTTLSVAGGSGTPPLSIVMTYDESQARLDFTWSADPEAAGVLAAWLHTGTAEKPGAARYLVYGPGHQRHGSAVLAHLDRRALAEGRSLVRVFRRGEARPQDLPLGVLR